MAYTKPPKRKKEWKNAEETEISSSLLILHLKYGKLSDSGEEEGSALR